MTNEEFIKWLKTEEGVVSHAYQDHLGYWTIGVGRLIDKRKGGGLSSDEIDYLLQNDVNRIIGSLDKALPWWKTLSPNRKAALTAMAFQMGLTNLLGFKKTLSLIKDGRYAAAAEQMLTSLWAKQTPARAKRTAELIRNG
jgi:lysozyme